MRKIVLITALLLAAASTVGTKSALAYPFGWEPWNAYVCGYFWKRAGKLVGDGGWFEAQCWSSFYGN